jgi:outer membrane autotransporter protein
MGGGQGGGNGLGGAGGGFETWGGQGGGLTGQPSAPLPVSGGTGAGTDGVSNPNGTIQPNGGKGRGNTLVITNPTQTIPDSLNVAGPNDGQTPVNNTMNAGGGGGGLGVHIKTSTYDWLINEEFRGGLGGNAVSLAGMPLAGGGGGGAGAVFEGDVLNLRRRDDFSALSGGFGAGVFSEQRPELSELIAGGGGVALIILKGTVNNEVSIRGGFGGNTGSIDPAVPSTANGGQGGSGVYMVGGTTLNNRFTITDGGTDNINIDNNPAILAKGDRITISNIGERVSIWRQTGANGQFSSTAAIRMDGDSNKIINDGRIYTDGSQSEKAVEFNGNDNTMELRGNYSFTSFVNDISHAVIANGSNNHLVLGGASNGNFNLSDIGAANTTSLFRGFADYTKTGASLWRVTGTTGHAGNWTLEEGTLELEGTITGAMHAMNGRLQGIGAVGALNHEANAIITPGSNGTGSLTVNGNYIGSGGLIEFSTVLGDDNSATTRLNITGDTSGTGNVKVTNRGGLGAATVNGIKLIEIGGQSDGNFVLQGDFTTTDGRSAVVAGAYAYTLNKNAPGNADGDWYLRSALKDGPGPDPDPGPGPGPGPGPNPNPTPLFNPGAPLYEGAVQSMQQLNRLPTLQQRVGNRYWSGASNRTIEQGDGPSPSDAAPYPDSGVMIDNNGVWARVSGSHSRVDTNMTTTQARQKVNAIVLQSGLDGMFYEGETGKLVGGINGNYGRATSTITSVHGNGKVTTEAWGLGGALTWYSDNGFYADGQVQMNWFTNDYNSTTARRGLANNQKALGFVVSAEAGRRFDLNEYWSVTPQAQLMWSSVGMQSFRDMWNTQISMNDSQSLIGRGGVSLDYRNSWQGNDGQLVRTNVYGIANLYRDFKKETSLLIADTNFAVQHERTWGGLGLGGTYSWAGDRYSVYGEATANTSLNNFGKNYELLGNVGFRVKW